MREIGYRPIAHICTTNSVEDYSMSIVWIKKDARGGKSSVYSQYKDKPVMITTPNGEMLFTPCVMKMLGEPKAVRIGIDTDNKVVFQPSEDVLNDFKVQYVRGGKGRDQSTSPGSQMARVSANQLTRHNGMISDTACFVWTVEDCGGFLGVDIRQKRGIIPYHRRNKNGSEKS
jgi:hypothetical protein